VVALRARQEHWGEILVALPRPLAVFAITDDLAADIVSAAALVGLRVPEDVAVLGVQNDELICESLPVSLSSIDNNLEAVGYQAASLLHRHLVHGEPLPDNPVLIAPIGVVERRSTDIFAVRHPDVQMALRFIKQNFRKPIQTEAIVAATSLSQRALYTAFRQVLGLTIHDQVVRERIDLAKRLLLKTDASIESIAADVGFGETRTMYTHFKRDTGAGPKEWRNTNRGRQP
jgi:LacI family transcriptional regulator